MIFVIVFIIIALVSIAASFWHIKYGNKKSKHRIIKNFKNNIEQFEKSIQELENEKEIDFNRYGKTTIIEYINDEGKLVKIKEENYYKYEQTIALINLLELSEVYKTNDSIIFIFNRSFRHGSTGIAYIPNLKYDMWRSNKVSEKEQIEGNWYYIVIETL